MLRTDGRGFGGSTRPSASPQGSRLRASLGQRDSVSVLESAWQAQRSAGAGAGGGASLGVLNASVGASRATAQRTAAQGEANGSAAAAKRGRRRRWW